MNIKYYLKNSAVTFLLTAFIYWESWNVEWENKIIFLTIATPTALLYPFSKYLMGKFAVRIAGNDFWDKLISGNGPAGTRGVAFCFMLCLIFSIPLGILCVLFEIKKAAKKHYFSD
ncbi:MAG: hypothetical protein ABN482_01465 [Corticimicrobacter sp.]|uniref:hypothetical protein n=1 Tax=Corticimicrobacter sp. TaxID=2678536 RepID=UPI0032DBD800